MSPHATSPMPCLYRCNANGGSRGTAPPLHRGLKDKLLETTRKNGKHILGCFRKPRCQQSVYDSEVWFEVYMFRRYDSGYDSPYLLLTISYIKGLAPTPSWRLGLFSEGADWAMAQQSEVWVWFGVCIRYDSGYGSGRRLFVQKQRRTELCQIQNHKKKKDAHLVY